MRTASTSRPALLEADVARRRADQPRDGVLLHVLAHVVALELVAEVQRELLGELGLADAGRPGEEERAGRTIRLAEPGARALDRARDQLHRFFLAEDDASERLLERLQAIAVRRGRLLGRNARHPRDDFLDLRHADVDDAPIGFVLRRVGGAAEPRLARPLRRARRWRCRAAGSRAGAATPASPPPRARRREYFTRWCAFVARAQALQDAHGLRDRRLVDRDLLQPPRERAVLLDVLVLLVRRRADDAQLAGRQDRLDQRRQIHRAAGGRAGADGRVNLVDEEDRHAPLARAR